MLKVIVLSILFLMLQNIVDAQKLKEFGLLKKANEEVVYGFGLQHSNKIALLCRHKNNKYLIYRFGTIDRVELQYPAELTSSSWKLFRFSGYWRGGNPKDVLDLYSISFTNNGIGYKIYQNDSGEDNGIETGILVSPRKKAINLIGNVRSEVGALSFFNNIDDLMHNYYWDDSQ